MNHHRTSDGERIPNSVVERRTRIAKAERLQIQIDKHGYNFCEICKKNDCKPVDCSHDKSVKWCKENNCVELAWDVNNITPTGRNCHKKKDGLNLKFNKYEK